MMSRILLGGLLFLAVVSAQRGKALDKKDRMSVWEPELLKYQLDKLEDKKSTNLDFRVGNFGNIPWGKTILGTVIVPNDEVGCEAPPKDQIQEMLKRTNETKFVLMKRGNCSFVQKAFNAQLLGANLVIFRNSDTGDVHQMEMVSDGSITDIDIPALLINKDQGKIIHDFVSKYQKLPKKERENDTPASLSVYFHWSRTDKVHYDLWMSSGEDASMKFLRDFAPKIKNLSSTSTEFVPHYVQLECFWCSINKYQDAVENCFSGGRYCAIDPDGSEGMLDGREVLKEDLRQICILKTYNQKVFLEYASKFYEKCLKGFKNKEKTTLTDCSYNLMSETGIYKPSIDKCYDDSWELTREVPDENDKNKTKIVTDPKVNELLQDNLFLRNELKKWKQQGLGIWPAIIVNKIAFKGDLNPDRIYEAICRSFNTPPKDCNLPDFREIPANPDAYRGGRKTFWKLFGLIIGGLIGVMTLFFFIYRRYVRRAITEELNGQINSAVSSYFRMGDTSRVGKGQTA